MADATRTKVNAKAPERPLAELVGVFALGATAGVLLLGATTGTVAVTGTPAGAAATGAAATGAAFGAAIGAATGGRGAGTHLSSDQVMTPPSPPLQRVTGIRRRIGRQWWSRK
jgi:hypothetical protein